MTNLDFAIKHLQSAKRAETNEHRARVIGMAINYLATDLRYKGHKKQAKAIMKVAAEIVEGVKE